MPTFREQIISRTALTEADVARLSELISEWQLLADLSFADLTLWAPVRTDYRTWPEGHIALAHIRPTTAATVFVNDVVGEEILGEHEPVLIKHSLKEK